MLQVVLTQPNQDNLSGQLHQLGYKTHHLPFIAIRLEPADAQILLELSQQADMIIAISPAVVAYLKQPAMSNLYVELAKRQWYTPGAGTAKGLLDLGIKANFPSDQFNAKAMLAIIPLDNKSKRALWLGSDVNDQDSISKLKDSGVDVHELCCYTREAIEHPIQKLRQLSQCYWIVSSASSLQQAATHWSRANMQPKLIVTSERLKTLAASLGYTCSLAESIAAKHIHQLLCSVDDD